MNADKTCRQWPMRNLKEAGVESATQMQMNLRKAGSEGEEAGTTKAQYPIRKPDQVLKVSGQSKNAFLPGDDPFCSEDM